MYTKTVPLEDITRDTLTTEMFIEDKLERQASYGLLRCILSQLGDLVATPLQRGTLPASVRVGALQDPSLELMFPPDSAPRILNTVTGVEEAALPQTWHPSSTLIVSNVIGRGSTGAVVLFALMSKGYLWSVAWDPPRFLELRKDECQKDHRATSDVE